MSGRPRQFNSDDVLQAATDAFWRNGYEATSAQSLVESTGIGRGSLYAAYGSKENLHHAALRNYHAQSLSFHREALGSAGTIKEKLLRILVAGVERDLEQGERNGCMTIFSSLERSARDPFVQEITRRHLQELERMFEVAFRQAAEHGEICQKGTLSSADYARRFMNSYFGLRVFGRMVHDRSYLERSCELIISDY